MDSIRSALQSIRDPLAWLPDSVVALIILALAAGIAYAVHKSLSRLLRRLLAGRYPAILSMFTQTRSVSRMALLILAMIIAIPVAPIPYETAALLARVLSIAIIGLVGWAAIIALNLAADLYLRRFRIDTEDNLLARKHFTQIRVLLRTADVLVAIVTVGAALMTFEPVRQYGLQPVRLRRRRRHCRRPCGASGLKQSVCRRAARHDAADPHRGRGHRRK